MNLDSIIAGKMTDLDSISKAYEIGLTPNMIVSPVAQRIVKFSFEYWQKNKLKIAPTEEILAYEFPQFTAQDSTESMAWLVESVKKRYVANRLTSSLLSASEQIDDSPQDTLNDLFRDVSSIIMDSTDRTGKADLSENMQERQNRYFAKQNNEIPTIGAPYGFSDIDEFSRGILPGELAVIAAYTKVGKSWSLVKSAVEAVRSGYTPLLVSMELSKTEMEERIDSVASGVSYSRLQSGTLRLSDVDALKASQSDMAACGKFFLEVPRVGQRTVAHLVTRAHQLGANYLIIDQMSFIEGRERHYRSKKEKYDEIIHDLKSTISEPGNAIPAFLAHQLNRDSTKADRVSLSHLADASEIERAADIIFGLSRTEEQKANNMAVLELIAGRRTESAAWNINMKFKNETEMSVIDRRTY